MAQLSPVEQFKLRLSIWREAIPKYEEGTKLLSHFMRQCSKFSERLTTADAVINEALFVLIKMKISGEALDLVIAHNPTTWDASKTLLISRYSDPSSEELLFNKLSVCFQQSNKTYEKYADEIKNRLNKIKGHIELNETNVSTVTIKKTFYENFAKNVFINEIKEPYHTHLTHFDLANVEECLVKCRKLDNHKRQAAFLTFMRQRENMPKSTVFTTVGNTRNNNPFHVTYLSLHKLRLNSHQ